MGKFVLSIDQGTSGTKVLVVDEHGKRCAKASQPLNTLYLQNGFVEQDPEEIFQNVLMAVRNGVADFESRGGRKEDIVACGISNQRETFVLWDDKGKPLCNAVVWQCKRSIEICERWKATELESIVKANTGLLRDPYFSGTKVVWLYENNDKVKAAIDAGNAHFGTIDTWLLHKLTGGESYFTDYTNASRTLFFNLKTRDWDKALLKGFGLERLRLPQLKPSSALFGRSRMEGLLPSAIDIAGMIGDSHAASFGEGCFTPGKAKATLGTGCSILMNTGELPRDSKSGMVTTICWSTGHKIHYALEGVIVTCGGTIEWLKNQLELFEDSRETEAMATAVPDNGGVYLIPAFSGLGAPHWDMTSKASIKGLTFGSRKNHLVRAALESIAYQIKDVIVAMEADMGMALQQLMVDGGITSNQFVMQFLSDLLNKAVVVIDQPDVSALGAAYMAGLQAGLYKDLDHLMQLNSDRKIYTPCDHNKAMEFYKGWQHALSDK